MVIDRDGGGGYWQTIAVQNTIHCHSISYNSGMSQHTDLYEPKALRLSILVSLDGHLLNVTKRFKDPLEHLVCDVVVQGSHVQLTRPFLLHEVLCLSSKSVLLGHCGLNNNRYTKHTLPSQFHCLQREGQ